MTSRPKWMQAVLLLAAASVLTGARQASNDETITLGIGQQKVIPVTGGVQRVAIGDAEIADVRAINNREVLVTGVGEGRTTLLIWRPNESRISYTVNVRAQDPNELVSELRVLLGQIEGVTIRIVGDRVYIDGETLTTDDADRVARVAALYPQVRSFVRASTNSLTVAARNLIRVFSENGLRSISAKVVGNTIFLEGSVGSPEDLKKAEMLVKAMGLAVENLITVGIKRMVLVEVQIVEIRRSDDWGIGITYPTNLTGDVGLQVDYTNIDPPMAGQLPSQTNILVNGGLTSNAALRMRFDSGYGRLLSQPRLVCASGEKASFLVGGEVPIPMVSQLGGVDVQFKEFGVILELTPNADALGNIQTTIKAEVSDVDRSLTVRAGGLEIPGFRKRVVETNVTVRHGETIALSGMFNYDQQKNVSKVPLLGHIPILGELFKTREFTERKNEIAVFVTPTIVNPDSDRIREMIEKIKERYKDASSAVGFNIWD